MVTVADGEIDGARDEHGAEALGEEDVQGLAGGERRGGAAEADVVAVGVVGLGVGAGEGHGRLAGRVGWAGAQAVFQGDHGLDALGAPEGGRREGDGGGVGFDPPHFGLVLQGVSGCVCVCVFVWDVYHEECETRRCFGVGLETRRMEDGRWQVGTRERTAREREGGVMVTESLLPEVLILHVWHPRARQLSGSGVVVAAADMVHVRIHNTELNALHCTPLHCITACCRAGFI